MRYTSPIRSTEDGDLRDAICLIEEGGDLGIERRSAEADGREIRLQTITSASANTTKAKQIRRKWGNCDPHIILALVHPVPNLGHVAPYPHP